MSEAANRVQPVRNDVEQSGDGFLVLRHQKLKKGGHQAFYESSRDGVWPWFERIGTRIIGQWQIVYPEGNAPDQDYDEGFRLACYKSEEHWKQTRAGANIGLGGDGPNSEKNSKALAERNKFLIGSDGPYFLRGHMTPGGPYHMPGLDEQYEQVGADTEYAEDEPRPVRNDVAVPGEGITTLRYWKIQKGGYDQFYQASLEGVWPFGWKMGTRAIGQWQVIHPGVGDTQESESFDEIIMMTRYASYEHWQATRDRAALGGNGPDFKKSEEALEVRRSLTIDSWVKFMKGYLYHSPPVFMPALKERYRGV